MGLDITLYEMVPIESFRAGSYSGFGEFRRLLALSVGIDLDNQAGFGGKQKEWTKEETYYELLNHSDCEDDLAHWECEQLIDDFTPENREAFSKTLDGEASSSTGDELVEAIQMAEYYLGKWDKWKEVIEKCAESEDCMIVFH